MSDGLAATQTASDSGGTITNNTFWDTVTSARDIETTSVNYWPEFETLQYFELTYIILLIVLGTFGNCIVIFSIIVSRKVHSNGNIFVINLAIADLMVCVITFPSMAANILSTRNVLVKLPCDILGYIVTATCGCSLANLSLIAFNRYWAVVRYASYRRRFTSRVGISMAIGAWIWSVLLVLPSALGWGAFTFDAKALLCTWDEGKSISYSIFLIGSGVTIPLFIIAFSYFKVFSIVKSTGKWRRSLHTKHGNGNHTTSKRLSRRERSLLRTLLATIVAFCVCWTPYSLHVLIDPVNISPHLKKFLVWLALSNSCVNFIIYGVLNPSFKRGYKRLFYFVFRCFNDNSVPLRTRTAWSSGHTGNPSGIQMPSLSPQAIESPSVDEVTTLAMNQMNGQTAISPKRRIAQEPLSVCGRLKALFTKKSGPSSFE